MTCPGLNLSHGFIHHIRQHQFKRLQQDSHLLSQSPGKPSSPQRKAPSKPSLILYRPPAKNCFENGLSEKDRETYVKDSTKIEECKHFEGNVNGTLDNLDYDEVDIENYLLEAQPYIKKALTNPGSVGRALLHEVCRVIVNRGWEDPQYFTTAAKLCAHIAMKEYQQQDSCEIPDYVFRRSVLELCKEVFEGYQEIRNHSMTMWLSFVHFMVAVYVMMRVNGEPLMGLLDILLAIVKVLAQQPSVSNFDEVEVLSSIFHDVGEDLQEKAPESMCEVMSLVRDGVLHPDSHSDVRRLLLEIVELSASSWQLQHGAAKYYYGS